MLLALDAGNTNIVFAVFEGTNKRAHWRMATRAERTADELMVFLGQWLASAGIAVSNLHAAIISSVVPDLNFHLRQLCERHLSLPTLLVDELKAELPIAIRLDRPEEVGADRIVNALAGRLYYRLPQIIIDFGTATTFDVVDAAGDYQGGIIAPGPQLALQALHGAAAKLPRVAIARPPSVIGKNTVHAMQSGLYWGYVALLEGLVARLSKALPTPPMVVATGGLASLFAGATTLIDVADDDLTLKGLQHIHTLYSERRK